jgi:hypothetical protein
MPYSLRSVNTYSASLANLQTPNSAKVAPRQKGGRGVRSYHTVGKVTPETPKVKRKDGKMMNDER